MSVRHLDMKVLRGFAMGHQVYDMDLVEINTTADTMAMTGVLIRKIASLDRLRRAWKRLLQHLQFRIQAI